jgi:16S rRNA (guanine966-N2)-methyltransferase
MTARATGPHREPPREVRIIGGLWKRSKLPVADRPGLRPTMDRVRETLFNWLGQELNGWRCLDAFAGTGALGFEAASRGASEVVLLERDVHLARALREVQQRLHATQVSIEAADALAWMKRCAPRRFDLIFIDPPFEAELGDAALEAAVPLIVPDGFVYLEAPQPCDDSRAHALGLVPHRSARAGAVSFQLLRVLPPGSEPIGR